MKGDEREENKMKGDKCQCEEVSDEEKSEGKERKGLEIRQKKN